MEETTNENLGGSSILDTIMGSQTQSSLNSFEPAQLVSNILASLKDRDREIVSKRFGLDGHAVETLEFIGQKYNLTRERVRQIEKDSISLLQSKKNKELQQALELIFEAIIEHGSVMSEEFLIDTMLSGRESEREVAAVKFLLTLSTQIKYLKETNDYKPSWAVLGFSHDRLTEIITQFVEILKAQGRVLAEESLYQKFKQSEYFTQHAHELNDRALKSYLDIAKIIQINPFSEIGLRDWAEVKPRDVGDKAYLVLKHYGKPEHYSEITRLINERKFDDRTAFQETVHNELIKDTRFVLIGRGIYALSEWGYTKGVVADVIKDVIKAAGHPLSRDNIIQEVLKRRQVKRNTILVGLSNKKHFKKVDKDKYALAETQTLEN